MNISKLEWLGTIEEQTWIPKTILFMSQGQIIKKTYEKRYENVAPTPKNTWKQRLEQKRSKNAVHVFLH